MLDPLCLKENASLVSLPDGSELYQHQEGQKISSDNVDFNEAIRKRFEKSALEPKTVLELGLGNGINSIMLQKSFPAWKITGLEIDSEQAKLASYNCNLQKLAINVREADLREFTATAKFDLIIANPPYIKVGKGRQSPFSRTNLAKFELTCTMEDVFLALKRNISPQGEAWLLYSQAREADLMTNIKRYNFTIIDMIKKNKIIIIGLNYATN